MVCSLYGRSTPLATADQEIFQIISSGNQKLINTSIISVEMMPVEAK